MRYAIVLGAASLIAPALAQDYFFSDLYARGDDLDLYELWARQDAAAAGADAGAAAGGAEAGAAAGGAPAGGADAAAAGGAGAGAPGADAAAAGGAGAGAGGPPKRKHKHHKHKHGRKHGRKHGGAKMRGRDVDESDFLAVRDLDDFELAARDFDDFELFARDPEAEAWADPEADPEYGLEDLVFDY